VSIGSGGVWQKSIGGNLPQSKEKDSSARRSEVRTGPPDRELKTKVDGGREGETRNCVGGDLFRTAVSLLSKKKENRSFKKGGCRSYILRYAV